ncbi:unnamed protein product [Symbiodinium natans]|uniref:Exoribonuclease Xrn1 D2/D3 domain-containing protein n=1 Tax=Symbiodinium natans TaxID=878477 RepID=A0A812J5K2_9DINO|nr:unnamed protein product [Symbiodinium natans]
MLIMSQASSKTTSVDVHNGVRVKTLARAAWHQLFLPADDQPEARHSENWWDHKTNKPPDLALIDESGPPLSPSAAFCGFIEANRCLTLVRCADVDTNALTCIGKFAGESEYKLAEYYIMGEGDNALLQDLNNASALLASSNKTIAAYGTQVEALCSWRGLPELQDGAAKANHGLEVGSELLSEQNVYRYYDVAVRQDLCKTTIVGLGWLVIFQVVVGLLLLPMLVCAGCPRFLGFVVAGAAELRSLAATSKLAAAGTWSRLRRAQSLPFIVHGPGVRQSHQASCVQEAEAADERERLQTTITQVLQEQQAQLKWYDLQQLAKQVELEAHVVQQIVGSVMARCADYIREDLGMNLVAEPQGSPACLPCYSCKMPKGWIFSDLAVGALKDYREKFPGLFEALRSRRGTNTRQVKDLEQRAIFPDRADKDYCSRQLVKYCNSCEWKKLKLAPTQYMAMTTQSVSQVAWSVDEALKHPGPAIKIVDDAPGYLHDFHMGYRFFGVEDPDLENCAENVPEGDWALDHGPSRADGTNLGI